jgi:2-deoxy-D-gluconate 3-dehydrogenase
MKLDLIEDSQEEAWRDRSRPVVRRIVFVSGGMGGIGSAICRRFAQSGHTVIAGCLPDYEKKHEWLDSMRAQGFKVHAAEGDVADFDSTAEMFYSVRSVVGPIDILVNNAGTIRRYAAADYPADEWDATIRIDLDAVFLLSQRIGRGMVERGRGKIVNIASLLSFQGGIRVAAYTAAKHGVAGVTRALANEWAGSGVNVNAIAPGYVRTDNTQALQDDVERSGQILARIPAGRWGEPDDIAGAAVFLASPASDYVNGHLLVVDGGWMSR